jgi:hypothetical protein
MTNDACKLSGLNGSFVKAHIVPECFYMPGGATKSYVSDGASRPKRSRVGLYDPRLVIAKTERELFGPLDDCGIKFLRMQSGTWKPLLNEDICDGWLVSGIEYTKLKLFFTSILWRATASTLVDPPLQVLGLEEQLRTSLLLADPGRPERFAVSLIKYRKDDGRFPVMLPLLQMIDDTLGALALFGGYEILWYLNEPSSLVQPERILRGDGSFVVLERPWQGSRPQKMLRDLAVANKLR